MFLILMLSLVYFVQVVCTIAFMIEGEIKTKKELYLWFIPYPYWCVKAIIWTSKFVVKTYIDLPKA